MAQATERVTSSQTAPYTPEQQQWLGQALSIYGPQLGQGENVYGGQRVAPFSETQQTALGGAQGFLDNFSATRDMPLYGETGTALTGILSGQTGAQSITPEATQDYYRGAIEDPARRRWSRDIRPAIQESYSGPGYWSGARAHAETEGAQELGDWLGTQRSQLEWDVGQTNRALEEARAGRALAAIDPAMQYGRQPTEEALSRLGGVGQVYGMGQQEQQQQQAEINAAMQRFAEENRITNPEDMQILMSLLNLQYGTQTGAETTWDPNYWTRFGMGALSGISS